ncbi:hypothetical protein SteCoe_12727 [Stentor coeruleus]|uniref:Uncharacterized protein n=1 Tax=Stentor coeruleus TaxID=5963 RepID=A0A1R2CA51_9CILI|nr:hypothetical protein SteCoe_12727 [Stentor coeruleus]
MYTTKHALILGICNMLVGSVIHYSSFQIIIHTKLQGYIAGSISYMIGCFFAEFYYLKLGEKKGLGILWCLFIITYFSLNCILINKSPWAIMISGFGLCLSQAIQALLGVVEIGYITAYVKSNPNTYALSLLMSFSVFPYSLSYFYSYLNFLSVTLIFLSFCTFSLVITRNFKAKSLYHSILSSKKPYTILPFSAFLTEFYACGAFVGMFDIGNSLINPSNAFITDSFGYAAGSFLVIFLMNFHKRFIILGIILFAPIIAIMCIGISTFDTDYKYFAIWFINIAYGIIEVMTVRLILVNSNRPEFFVAMYYLVTTLGEMLMFICFKY